ncbi:MAG: PAS domain S-box protein [Gammaproteobacteria bacterium]|nr:PAS domain S-box protein [Gammaproteobacteria bacterium]
MAEGQSHFEARLTRLPDSTQMIAVVRDITREHHDRNALAASEIRYRQLFEQSPAPLLVYEKGSLRLLAVNEAFIHHYGYSQDEALAMTLPDLYPDAERQSLIDMAAKLAGLSYVGEWHHLKKDGSPITIEARSHDMLYEGHAARIAVITDITKRKKMELRLLDQLEELTRWQAVMLGREERVQGLKAEVNQLLSDQDQPIRYPSQADPS